MFPIHTKEFHHLRYRFNAMSHLRVACSRVQSVKYGTRIFRWRSSKCFHAFRVLPHGYIWTTILSEIDRALHQIVHHSQGDCRPPCDKSWEYCCGPVKVASMTSPCLKNNMQVHEMTRITWPNVVPYFLKPTINHVKILRISNFMFALQFKVSPTIGFQLSLYT